MTPRPLEALARLTDEANEHCGQAHYSLAGHDVGSLLAESQASALTVPAARRDQAFTAAVTACFVAGVVSSRAGHVDLAATAARRSYDLAQQLILPRWAVGSGRRRCTSILPACWRRRMVYGTRR
ncbi:MAG: hypothetical protein ACRDSZ_15820 [Pseudonocardiaceae bacterium]